MAEDNIDKTIIYNC